MNVRVDFRFYRDNIVPSGDARVAWLEKHGVIPADLTLHAIAPVSVWARVTRVDAAGEASPNLYCGGQELRNAMLERLRADPTDLSDFDATELLSAAADAFDEQKRVAEEKQAREEAECARVGAILSALQPSDALDEDGRLREDCHPDFAVMVALRKVLANETNRAIVYPEETSHLRSEQERRVAAAKAAAIAAIGKWVAENGEGRFAANIVRAAKEGRDVRGSVRAAVESRIKEAIRSVEGATIFQGYGWETDKRTPTERAYSIRDAIVALEPQLRAAACLPDIAIDVSDFGRVDIAETGKAVWRSGLKISVKHAWFQNHELGCSVLTEPLNDDEEDEEEEF